MEATMAGHEAIGHDDLVVHNWRAAQLKRLRTPGPLNEVYADHPAALLAFAHAHNATQPVLGATPRTWLAALRPSSQHQIAGNPPRRRTRRAHRHLHIHRQRRPSRGV